MSNPTGDGDQSNGDNAPEECSDIVAHEGVIAAFNDLRQYYLQKERIEHQLALAALGALGVLLYFASERAAFLQPQLLWQVAVVIFLIVMLFFLWRVQQSQRKADTQLTFLRTELLRLGSPKLPGRFDQVSWTRSPYWSFWLYLIVFSLLTMIVVLRDFGAVDRLSTQAISLRLPLSLLEQIKVEANKQDVPYESLIKVWLTEKVGQSQSPTDSLTTHSRCDPFP